MALKEIEWVCTAFVWLRIVIGVGYCEHGNELSGSVEDGEYLDYLSECQFLKKDSVSWSFQEVSATDCNSKNILHRKFNSVSIRCIITLRSFQVNFYPILLNLKRTGWLG
jgi:hypothetical protein